MRHWLLLVLLFNGSCEAEDAVASTYLDRAINSIWRTTDVFIKYGRSANADAFASVAFSEGILRRINGSLYGDNISRKIEWLISKLSTTTTTMFAEFEKFATEDQRNYVSDFKALSHWSSWDIDAESQEIEDVEDLSGEVKSDLLPSIVSCFVKVMKNTQSLCIIPDECYQVLLERLTSEYVLTHQLFLAMIWDQGPCNYKLRGFLMSNGTSLNRYYQKTCGRIFREAKRIEQEGFAQCLQDLFMEQLAFCQAVGMKNFLLIRWFNQITSWQSTGGCYLGSNEKCHLNEFTTVYNSRRKRSEVSIREGDEICLLHKTAVATMYFATTIKHILTP